MPITQILPDGNVEIYGLKTGEIKKVRPEELGQYNPALIGEYREMLNQQTIQKSAQEAAMTALSSGAPENVIKAIDPKDLLTAYSALQEKGIDIPSIVSEEGTPEDKNKKARALRVMDELEKSYGRGQGEFVGSESDISLGKTGFLGKSFPKIGRKIDKTFGTNKELTQDITKYKNLLGTAAGPISQALGSGTPQAFEFERLMEAAPNEFSTNEEAKSWFESIRNIVGDETNITKKKTSSRFTIETVN